VFEKALEAVRRGASEAAAVGRLPEFLAAVEAVRVEAVLSAARSSSGVPARKPAPNRVLSVEETARRLSRSKWWVYRNRHVLPMVNFPPTDRGKKNGKRKGSYGFSERRLEAWIEGRTGEADG
jgi:hypothetical protein